MKYQTIFERAMIKYEDLNLKQEVFGEGERRNMRLC